MDMNIKSKIHRHLDLLDLLSDASLSASKNENSSSNHELKVLFFLLCLSDHNSKICTQKKKYIYIFFSDFLMSSSEVSCQPQIQEVTPSSEKIIQHITYDTTATCTEYLISVKNKLTK